MTFISLLKGSVNPVLSSGLGQFGMALKKKFAFFFFLKINFLV